MAEFRSELFINDLPVTIVGLSIVGVAALIYYSGKKTNQTRALNFFRKHKPLFMESYGYMKTAILREAPSTHRAYLSDRENVEGTIVDFFDKPHQDALAYVSNFFIPFHPHYVICTRLTDMFPHTFLMVAKNSFAYLDGLDENYLHGLRFYDFGDFVIFTETAEVKEAYLKALEGYDMSGINFLHVSDYDPEAVLANYIYIQSRGDFVNAFNLSNTLINVATSANFAHSAKKIDSIREVMKKEEIEAEKEKKEKASKKEKSVEEYEKSMQRKMRRRNY